MMENPKINVRSNDPSHIELLLDLLFATTGIEPEELQVFRHHKRHGIIFARSVPDRQHPTYQPLVRGHRSAREAIRYEIERYLMQESNRYASRVDTNRRTCDRYDPDNDGIEEFGYRFYTKQFDPLGPNEGGVFAVTPSFCRVGK